MAILMPTRNRQLQMLIDVKADSTAVLAALIALLGKYPV